MKGRRFPQIFHVDGIDYFFIRHFLGKFLCDHLGIGTGSFHVLPSLPIPALDEICHTHNGLVLHIHDPLIVFITIHKLPVNDLPAASVDENETVQKDNHNDTDGPIAPDLDLSQFFLHIPLCFINHLLRALIIRIKGIVCFFQMLFHHRTDIIFC